MYRMYHRIHRFDLLVTFGCLALLAYFGWYAAHGARGFPFRDTLNMEVGKLASERDQIETSRRALEARVRLMRPESIDPDMLEELARTQLEMSRPNDLIVRFQP